MRFERKHGFGKEEAISRLKALTNYWSHRYGINSSWQGDRAIMAGKVKGLKFNGDVKVDENQLVAEVKVGFLAEKLGGKDYVSQKLDQYLDPNVTLEELQAKIS
ncbi:MAG: polyhydroxyalkanoic acid system family protein [Pseudomonadota bacterium]